MQLPKPMLKAIPKEYFDSANNTLKLLWEDEWRGLGITQVRNPHTLLEHIADSYRRAWAGSITKCMSLSRIYSSSSKCHPVPFTSTLVVQLQPANHSPIVQTTHQLSTTDFARLKNNFDQICAISTTFNDRWWNLTTKCMDDGGRQTLDEAMDDRIVDSFLLSLLEDLVE